MGCRFVLMAATSPIILHISDVQCGRFCRYPDKETLERLADQMLKDLETTHIIPDIIVVSGDMASTGAKKEYELFEAFLSQLVDKLSIERYKVVLVPGNHDIHRKLAEDSLDERYLFYLEFVNRFYEPMKASSKILHTFEQNVISDSEELFTIYSLIDDYNLLIVGYNSCVHECHHDESHHGWIGEKQMSEVARQLQNQNIPEGVIRIAVAHHGLWPAYDRDFTYIQDSPSFQNHLRNTGYNLFLHGHQHYNYDSKPIGEIGERTIYAFSSGSLATKPQERPDVPQQYKVIKFHGVSIQDGMMLYRADYQAIKDLWVIQEIPVLPAGSRRALTDERLEASRPLVIPESYTRWVDEFHSTMAIEHLAEKGEAIRVNLPEVYIHLTTNNPFRREEEERIRRELGGVPSEKYTFKEPTSIDIEELMGRKDYLLLKGPAGSGKTTLVKHLTYVLTHNQGPENLKGYLPVMVFLKDLGRIHQETLALERSSPTVKMEGLLEKYLDQVQCGLPWETVKNFLSQNRVLILWDGLDEVPETLRNDLIDIMAQFHFQYHENRFLITARPHGVCQRVLDRFGTNLHAIDRLNQGLIEKFVRDWFLAISGKAIGTGRETAVAMISAVRDHPYVSVFTENPLLLTAVCILYQVGKRLPEQRADLYKRIIENLLHKRFEDPKRSNQVEQVRSYLMHLAFTMHKQKTKTLDIGEAQEILKEVFPRHDGEADPLYRRRINSEFEHIEPHCGLLARGATNHVEFIHLTFQEFLTARYLEENDADWRPYIDDAWWEETLLLYAGFINLTSKARSNRIALEFLKSKARGIKKRYRRWLLGSRVLKDFQESRREEKALFCARSNLQTIISSDAPLEDRFQAGEILGYLGDLRIPIIPEVIKINDSFALSKFPVTNSQYRKFVEAEGYEKKEYWTKEGWKWRIKNSISEPKYWHERKWNSPNFPVVGVSWYEAYAYCSWLSRETRYRWRLPTEDEWYGAATSGKNREYPWGNEFLPERCNIWESEIERASPVGIFPQGATPETGLMDMAGNVWEWTDSWYDEKKKTLKVLCGGSWGSDQDFTRCSYRLRRDPDLRLGTFGFRCARDLK